jgi:branched-chain amino acid transport system ATP-binding protein
MSAALLEGVGLSRRFGGLLAVDGVDLAVGRDEVVGLIGPNGAGKTTLFNLLGGTLPPSAGRIVFDGADCTHLPSHAMARRGVTRTFQITSLFPRLSALDNVLCATITCAS